MENHWENERALAEIERLIDKGKTRSSEESTLLGLLLNLVEKFEAEHYPIPDAAPRNVLRHLREERGFRQRDLALAVRLNGLRVGPREREAGDQQGDGQKARRFLPRPARCLHLKHTHSAAGRHALQPRGVSVST
jgi:hypothetical protein